MADPKTYATILKSSALLGGAAFVNVLLGIIRVKVLAVKVGPSVFGTMALYNSLIALIAGVTSLSLSKSAVRSIAEAAGRKDEKEVALVVTILRRGVWITGLCGFVATIAFAQPISLWNFGTADHRLPIAVLGITVLLSHLQNGQTALLSGLRRMRELSLINIFGGVWSTSLAIPILLLFHERGIVPFLVAVAVGQWATSWWYAHRVSLPETQLRWTVFFTGASDMFRLGASMMVSGLALTASTYLIRSILLRNCGTASVGLYQSSFTICNIYVGFVLQAMSTDYYPRLAAVQGDRKARNRVINEQSEMAISLAVPGLVAALIFSQPLIWALYSEKFSGANDILRWQALGLLGRVVSWPLGFVLVARNDKTGFLVVELATHALHIAFVWIAVRTFGVVGAGVGFAAQYLFLIIAVSLMAKLRHNYRWERPTTQLSGIGSVLCLVAFASTSVESTYVRYSLGTFVFAVSVTWSLSNLVSRLGLKRVLGAVSRLRGRLPF